MSICKQVDSLIKKLLWKSSGKEGGYMALLPKMGWHLANHSNKMWVEFLLTKYCSQRRFIDITPKLSDLHVWKWIYGSLQT